MRDRYREYDCDVYGASLADDNVPIRKQKRARQREKQKRLKRQKPDKQSGFSYLHIANRRLVCV